MSSLTDKLETIYEKGQPFSTLFLRLFSAVGLMSSGYPKLLDLHANIELVESLGFYPGVIWSPALALSEFGAGLLLLIGLFTRFAAATGFVILSVAAYYHWFFRGEGYAGAEPVILWCAICLYFVFHGAKKYSLDRAFGIKI